MSAIPGFIWVTEADRQRRILVAVDQIEAVIDNEDEATIVFKRASDLTDDWEGDGSLTCVETWDQVCALIAAAVAPAPIWPSFPIPPNFPEPSRDSPERPQPLQPDITCYEGQ